MWRKYRESLSNKRLKRIKGKKASLIYQNQVLSVREIFSYTSKRHMFYHFFVQGNLPQIQKNKRTTQFLGIQLSKGSSLLMNHLIRQVLKREGSNKFFFIQYPLYNQSSTQYLLLLIHLQDESILMYYEDLLKEVSHQFTHAIDSLIDLAFGHRVD